MDWLDGPRNHHARRVARSSGCRQAFEPNLRRCILSRFRVLCCAVQGKHLATFAPTERCSLLVEPRFNRIAGRIRRIANTHHLVSARSDLNDAVCPRSGASANAHHDADNGSEGAKSFHYGGHQSCPGRALQQRGKWKASQKGTTAKRSIGFIDRLDVAAGDVIHVGPAFLG
jgi:hypothetical protein